MNAKVLLCADEESARHPELIGLREENLLEQPWLAVRTTAREARDLAAKSASIEEIWVVSCSDVEPINLAAAVKRDNPRRRVSMLCSQPSGSLHSRTKAAGIDETMTHQVLVEHYAARKRQVRALASGSCDSERETGPCAVPHTGSVSPKPVVSPGEKRATLITVVSGSGGAGKSAVSAVAAATLASAGIKTLLLDCDFQFGDMRELLGAKRAYGVDEVLSGAVPLSDLPRDEQGLCLIAAPRRLEQSETIVHELPALLDSAMAHFDAIVANTGANWGEQHAVLLERSSRALFLVDQRASSLRACKHAVELCARCGIAASPFLFVANRCSKRSLFSSIDVSCAMQGAHAAELKDGGVEVEQALGTGLAYDLVSSRNAFAQSVRELMGKVVGEAAGSLASSEESEAPSRGLFSFRRARREGVLP